MLIRGELPVKKMKMSLAVDKIPVAL